MLDQSEPDCGDLKPKNGLHKDASAQGSTPVSKNVAEMDNGALLDVIGIMEGVDKASLRGDIPCSWDYLRHFDREFRTYRHLPINILELGVASGPSLSMWLRYFDSATVIGIDIDPKCARFARGRAKVLTGSQDDETFLHPIVQSYPPTIIIDDGSHIAAHMIKSFNILFPFLQPGGIYVIEDLAFHFINNGGEVIASNSAPQFPSEPAFAYFGRLIAAKAAHVTWLQGASDSVNELYRDIDTITIIGGAIMVKKRAPRNMVQYARLFEQQLSLRQADGRRSYVHSALRYAEFLFTYNFQMPRAVDLLTEIAQIEPENVLALKLLHSALKISGRAQEAEEIASRLIASGQDVALPSVHCPEWGRYPHS